jgi:hypothetical protein
MIRAILDKRFILNFINSESFSSCRSPAEAPPFYAKKSLLGNSTCERHLRFSWIKLRRSISGEQAAAINVKFLPLEDLFAVG